MTSRARRAPGSRVVPVLLVVLALAWIGYQIVWHVTGTPAPTIDYAAKLMSLSSSGQPEGENGWPILMDALLVAADVDQAIIDREFPQRSSEWGEGPTPEWTRVTGNPLELDNIEKEQLALKLLREKGAYDLLAHADACTRIVQPVTNATPLFTMPLPSLASFRNFSKARVASMRLAAERGNMQEVIDAYDQTMVMARGCAAQPIFINYLVGVGIGHMLTGELRYELLEYHFDPATCRQLMERLEQPFMTPERSLAGERLMTLDAIQFAFTDDGHGDGQLDMTKMGALTFGGTPPGIAGAFGGIFMAGRVETTRVVNEFYDGCIQESRLPHAERASNEFDADVYVEVLSPRHVFARMIMPAVGKIVQTYDLHRMRAQATRIMLALQIHRVEHGAYPQRLDDLVPDILAEVPTDPVNGGAFIYRRDGETYLLYSMGRDGVDDSADFSGPVDPSLPPPSFRYGQTRGTDVLLNMPRDTWQW